MQSVFYYHYYHLVTVQLKFTLVETYPEVAPIIEITECSEEMTEQRINSLQTFLESKVSDIICYCML